MFLKHSTIYLFARGMPGIVNFIALAIFTRLLLPHEYGEYAILIAGVEFFYVTVFVWLKLGLLRFLPGSDHDNQNRLLSTILFSNFILFLIIGVIGICYLVWFFDNELNWELYIAGYFLLGVQSFFFIYQELLRAKLKPLKYGILTFLRAIIALALGILFIKHGLGALGLILGLIIGMMIGCIWMFADEWNGLKGFLFDKQIFIKILTYGLPLVASLALNAIIHNSDRLLIGALKGTAEAGIYASGYNLVQYILVTLMMVLNLAAYPIAVQLFEKKEYNKLEAHLRKYSTLILILILPISIYMSILSADFSRIFLGSEFQETRTIIPWLTFGILFASFRSYYTDLSFHLGKKTIKQVWIMLVAATVNIGLNLWWIPIFGIEGAAFASLIAYVIALILSFYLGKKIFSLPLPVLDLFKILLLIIMSFLILLLLPDIQGNIYFGIKSIFGIIIYLSLILVFNIAGIRNHIFAFLKSFQINSRND